MSRETRVYGLAKKVWLKRLATAVFLGATITSLSFWVMASHKAPSQFNWLLMPGAIVAIIIGFLTHYGEYWYASTLLGVNVIFYGLLSYAALRLLSSKRIR